MRVWEVDDYCPEYRTLVLRDPVGYEPAGPDPDDGEPAGTFAGAGIGWLTALTNGGRDRVRLEVHEVAPTGDETAFDDVMETPYHALSGRLSLTHMTAGVDGPNHLDLGGSGLYRVRVARKTAAGEGDYWLLRFWADSSLAPPVWRVRGRPAVGGGDSGWSRELPGPVMNVAGMVSAVIRTAGRAVTVDEVDEWISMNRGDPSERLDTPLWSPVREPQATGNADRDRFLAAQYASASAWDAGRRRRLDEIAAELGVPPIRGKRDVLPLLVAAGVLVRDDAGRYHVGRPDRVDTVLTLPARRVEVVRMSDARSRYRSLAEDVAAVVRWTSTVELDTTVADLAGRLLVTEPVLRDVLGFAEETGMLHVGTAGERLVLRRGPRPPAEPAVQSSR